MLLARVTRRQRSNWILRLGFASLRTDNMQLPMTGTWSIQVNTVRPFTIHGDVYYELSATRTDAPGEFILRVPQHASKSPPQAGQKYTAAFLMGQVTSLAL